MEQEMLNAYRFFLMRLKMSGAEAVSIRELDLFELELRAFVSEGI